jgi:tRNA U34 5-methylaminomethyl-2-thiouridine-forming methyltransferase MnmC
MDFGKKDIVITSDGTKTMYSHKFKECYHSVKDGALKESLYKHVIPAFNLVKKDEVNILDICYGLGFNTLTTIYYYKKYAPSTKLTIFSPEFDKELVKSLKKFEYPKEFSNLKDIINSLSDNFYYKDNLIEIKILIGDAREEIKKINKKIDIVYQDAFSPKKNPTLWTKEWFKDIKQICSKDAVITTYSVATPIRLALYENGFNIYKLQNNFTKSGTIASLKELDLEKIDMELKKQRNPNATALSDNLVK